MIICIKLIATLNVVQRKLKLNNFQNQKKSIYILFNFNTRRWEAGVWQNHVDDHITFFKFKLPGIRKMILISIHFISIAIIEW